MSRGRDKCGGPVEANPTYSHITATHTHRTSVLVETVPYGTLLDQWGARFAQRSGASRETKQPQRTKARRRQKNNQPITSLFLRRCTYPHRRSAFVEAKGQENTTAAPRRTQEFQEHPAATYYCLLALKAGRCRLLLFPSSEFLFIL